MGVEGDKSEGDKLQQGTFLVTEEEPTSLPVRSKPGSRRPRGERTIPTMEEVKKGKVNFDNLSRIVRAVSEIQSGRVTAEEASEEALADVRKHRPPEQIPLETQKSRESS